MNETWGEIGDQFAQSLAWLSLVAQQLVQYNVEQRYGQDALCTGRTVKIETLSKPSPKSILDKSSRQYKLSALSHLI